MNDIYIVIISLMCSGMFSGMEIAFLSTNRLQLELDFKKNKFSAKIITKFFKNQSQFIGCLLLCNNIANDLPITVNDASVMLELLYIDDLVDEMLNLLEGKANACEFDGINTVFTEKGKYYAVPTTHKVTLGEIVELL